MINESQSHPNGNNLVDLTVDKERSRLLKELARDLPEINLNERQLCDLELLATGAFSPLKGFMTKADYESVLDRMCMQDGSFWPMPLCLDIPEIKAAQLEGGDSVALRDGEGFLLAIMHIEDIWPVDRDKEAQYVYGTVDESHPGVNYIYSKAGDYYIGGAVEVISLPLHFDFRSLRLSPNEIRRMYKKLGWQRIVGFQTRNPIHRPQYEVTIEAMRQLKANLLLLPIVGVTQPGDFDYYTRVRCYRALNGYYPPETHLLGLLPLSMRLSGPRDALWQAVVARNYGCTHFIIGPNHGCPIPDNHDQQFYEPGEAGKKALEYSQQLGIEIINFEEMVYLAYEDEYKTRDIVPADATVSSMSGPEIRRRIRTGRRIPNWATFPEVVRELRKAYPPPKKQGFTVFLTGLSGAGKSTIAKVLYSRFLEIGERPVTLLDGDIVRRNLSSELGFSREHRDINVRRIGYVASEITKNKGIAICAPIAPYSRTRRDVRSEIQQYGGFIEIHVSTSLEICESRDRKGMYAKARAGLIKGFTGVDDPYEAPENPELKLDTADLTPDEAAQEILLYLGRNGFI